MFSGIIHHQARLADAQDHANGRTLIFEVPKAAKRAFKVGQSIAINGVCLTVNKYKGHQFWAEVMPQTLRITTAGQWCVGDMLNMEPSLRVGDEVGGHFVYGHVDAVATLERCVRDGDATVMTFRLPREDLMYLPARASVAVDGISLTVVESKGEEFSVSLLEQTLALTNLQKRKRGDRVNIEFDMIMRHMLHQQTYANK